MKGHALTTQPPNHQTKANTARGKNGIIHAMNNRDKSALALALAIVGGIAAGMRCDASVKVESSSQYTPRSVAYTVKAYTDPFIPNGRVTILDLCRKTRLSTSGVYKIIAALKAASKIRRVGPTKGGYWEVVE